MKEEEIKKEGGSFLSSLGRMQPVKPAAPSAQQSKPLPPSASAPPPPADGGAGQARIAELERTVKAVQAELQAVKTGAPAQDAKTEKELERINKKLETLGVAVKELDNSEMQERISASSLRIAGLEAAFSDMSKALFTFKKEVKEISAQYLENCLALKNGLKALKTDSEYLDSALEKLKEKASGLEKSFGPGLEELREKLASREKLEKRMFLELETGLEKAFQEKFKDLLAQLKAVREKLDTVSQDYRLVIDKRLLTLESKYSAFETLSRRLDSIAKDLKK
ncbi:MAG: hypothetical protein HY796_02735 [Elusimicrobia bacterium]|nr:hypothetical protein [Elusimicrobiota bacterium]